MTNYFIFDAGSIRILLCLAIFIGFWIVMKVLRKNTLSFKLVLSYIIIGFISSFIFYSLSQFQYYAFDQSEINTEPLMYLVFCFILLIVPFAFLEVKSIQYIDDSHIFQYLKYIGILLGILSLAPFLDGIMKLSSLNYSAIKDAYEGNDSSNTNIIVYYSVQLRNYLKFFIAPLFFYFLYKGEKCKLQFYFVVFALLTTILLSLLGGGRGTMVNECNYMVICYLIFKELLTEEKIKKLLSDVEYAVISGDRKRVESVIDVDSFVNMYICEELMKDIDIY